MITYLHKQFNNIISQLKNIEFVLVAISGGQDSICLVKLIEDFNTMYCSIKKIEYIYIDHQWRKDSKQQIKHLTNYIDQTPHNLSIYQIPKLTISELEARNLRYQIIIKHAIENHLSTIMTAHTQTDKIETFFQRLMRGASLNGTTSLNFKRQIHNNIQIIRPLIYIKRTDINWFCRKFFLPIWSDITNSYYNINRNRLRHELIPYLNQYFISSIEKHINKFIDESNINNDYIKQNAIKLYIISRHQTNIALNYLTIKPQHPAIQIRILQIFFYHNFNKALNRQISYQLLHLINKKNNNRKQIEWYNLIINIYNNWIYIN
uniref:tRNA(Ile)-lysidine synthase n=1 Tax=Sebdenia flabellata TaxID=42024 RepID=A0A1C9C9X9_9FLOR|nr:tRNA(Ile)-lysidine synthase [Sebdenia flabellata]AOM65184.1 tRNA(Ile)-lysidine synthase [Sebdenia flabellata]